MVSFFIGCSKDKSIEQYNPPELPIEPCPGDCLDDIDIASLTFGYNPKYYGVHHISPYYNPLNNDEFVFAILDYDGVSGSLNIYNTSSGLLTELWNSGSFSGGLRGQPRWTRSNWIVFGGTDNNIYKVKPDGTDLTQLTTSGDQVHPEVSYTGDEIIAFVNALGSPRMDINGVTIDTLIIGPKASWNSQDSLAIPYSAALGTAGIGLFDIGPDTIEQIVSWAESSNQDQIDYLSFHPSKSEIYYSKWSNGLYKVNFTNRNEELIRTGCFKHYYPSFSISNDGSTILACKLQIDSITPTHELAISEYLVTFDINGCNEEVINIP